MLLRDHWIWSPRTLAAICALFFAALLWGSVHHPFIGGADGAEAMVVGRNVAAGRGYVIDYVDRFYNYSTVLPGRS